MRLYVDGRLVVDSWFPRSANRDDAVMDLSAGRHQLRAEYFQAGWLSRLWLQLSPAGGAPTTSLPVVGNLAGEDREIHRLGLDSTRAEEALATEIRRKPLSGQPLINRAEFLAVRGRFAESARDFAAGLKLNPGTDWMWTSSAVVSLQAGDPEGYHRQCAEMLERFGASTDRSVCERIVKDCTFMRDAVPDLKPVLEMANRAVAPNDRDGPDLAGWRELAKGMAEYRAGNHAGARDWLLKAVLQYNPTRESLARFFLAMAEAKLGRKSDAEASFARGNELLIKAGPHGNIFPYMYKDWIIIFHVRDEAAKLLGHPLDPPATQASDAKAGAARADR